MTKKKENPTQWLDSFFWSVGFAVTLGVIVSAFIFGGLLISNSLIQQHQKTISIQSDTWNLFRDNYDKAGIFCTKYNYQGGWVSTMDGLMVTCYSSNPDGGLTTHNYDIQTFIDWLKVNYA